MFFAGNNSGQPVSTSDSESGPPVGIIVGVVVAIVVVAAIIVVIVIIFIRRRRRLVKRRIFTLFLPSRPNNVYLLWAISL